MNLLHACVKLWSEGLHFSLTLIGSHKGESMKNTINLIERLITENKPLKWMQDATDEDIVEAYAECDFIVYPSLYEGFGLPIIEAISYGKPVLTTTFGSLEEIAKGGGCLEIKDESADSIAAGIQNMIEDVQLYTRLQSEAMHRKTRTWKEYTEDLMAFADSLSASK